MKSHTFKMDATTNDGVKVPLKLTIEYPDGQGMVALGSLPHIAQSQQVQQAFVSQLVAEEDASLIASMNRAGMDLSDDDGEW